MKHSLLAGEPDESSALPSRGRVFFVYINLSSSKWRRGASISYWRLVPRAFKLLRQYKGGDSSGKFGGFMYKESLMIQMSFEA
jgi:hypothetical protein